MKTKIRKIPRVIISVVLALALLVSSSTAAMIISGASIGRQRTTGASTVVEEGVVEETDNETVGAADDEMVGAAADDDDMVSAAADDDSVGAVAEDNDESVGAALENDDEAVGTTYGGAGQWGLWIGTNDRDSMNTYLGLTTNGATATATKTLAKSDYFMSLVCGPTENWHYNFKWTSDATFTNNYPSVIMNPSWQTQTWYDSNNNAYNVHRLKFWCNVKDTEVRFIVNTTNYSITVEATVTIPNVASSVDLTTSTSAVTDASPTATLTATPQSLHTDLTGKTLTYTFYAGDTSLGSVTSNTDSATYTVTQTDQKTVNYKVKVSYTGYNTVTSNTVTIINSDRSEPLFNLVGAYVENDWANGQTINTPDPAYGANIYYKEVTVSNTRTNSNNFFKLKKDGSFYGPTGSDKKMKVNDEPVSAQSDSDKAYYIYALKSGTHRIYVDQTDVDSPKVWVEDDRDVFITNSTAFSGYIENDVVKKSNVGNFTSDDNTQFRAFSSGSIYSENAIKSDTPFMISNKKGVTYDVEYSIRQDLCTGVSLSQQHVMVGDAEDGDYAQVFHIQSNKVDSEYTKNITIHIDNDAKEIWATSTFDMSTITSKTVDSTKTVRYYFAVTNDCYDKFKDSSGNLKIHYWNNSLNHENLVNSDRVTQWGGTGSFWNFATAVPVRSNGSTENLTDSDNNTIYVDMHNPVAYIIWSGKSVDENEKGDTNFKIKTDKNMSNYNVQAKIFCADIPVWATSFAFANNDGFSFMKYDSEWFSQRGIVLNPNRVYLAYKATDNKYYTTAVRLDESLWTANTKKDADEDKKFIKYFKTNLIKYKAETSRLNPTMNKQLLLEYWKRGIENELYFGGFWNEDEKGDNIKPENGAVPFGDVTPTNWKIWNNLAQRQDAYTDAYKFKGHCAFYAVTWDLAGSMLDKSKTNNLGGWLLTDTYQKDVLPFFDYDTLYSSDNTTGNANIGTVYKNVDFPFYKTTYKGITSYSYDSMSDYNREYNVSDKKYTFTNYKGLNDMQGYQPFADQVKSFANEFDVNFYMTPTGYLKDSSNNNQDIAFNFSGDDDVWVYIDGVKVLDLGGAHMISAASINLSDMKVYYKTPAKSTMSLSSVKDDYSVQSNSTYAVDLTKLFAAYGIDFKNTDASTHHTLQMFYMERGQNESNCSISFNLPQNSGLRIQNEIDTSGVNKGLVDATLRAANLDYFSYYVENKLASGDQRSTANTFYNMNENLPAVAEGEQSQTFYTDTPKFPAYNQTTVKRVSQGITQLLLTGGITTGATSAKPSLPETHPAGTAFGLSGIKYSLADAYASGTIDDTLSGTVLDYYVDNVKQDGVALNLLYGESATFNSKITPHTWLEVKQHNQLYYPDADNSTIIRGAKVDDNIDKADKRNVSRFYSTSYTITDDSANKTMNKVTSVNNLEEDVVAHSGDNTTGYYFSNYSGTTDVDDNVAATYKFVNSPHTGTININKIIDATNPNPKASFKFTIQFKDIFGVSNDKVGLTADQYSDYPVKYKVVDADGNVSERDYGVTKGILLRNGETAQILGIPAGTHYQIIEQERSGYELEKIIKSAYRSGVMKNGYPKIYTDPADFTKDADIDYQSKNDTGDYLADFAFYNKPVLIKVTLKYYDRYVHSGGETEISSSPTSYSYTVPDWDTLPKKDADNNDINWYTEDVDGEYTYINTQQLITYTTGLADIGNVIAGYTFWTNNTEARTEIAKAEHVRYNIDTKIGKKYSEDYTEAVLKYHTNYIGTPVATAEDYDTSARNDDMWVCYKDKSGSVLNFDTPSTENYKDIATIEVWGYNYPKEYSITPHTVAADEDSNELTTEVAKYNSDGEVINGSDEPAYIVGTASGTPLSGNLYNTRVGGAYWPHYNADMSNKDLEDAKVILLNRPSEYFQEYGLEKGYTGEYPVTAESFISENKTYKFAYWASDAAGKNKITSDYNYGYRIVKTMDIYPVYFPSDIVKTPSLSLTSLTPDTYTSGSTVYRRINNIVAVSDLEPYDSNLTDVTALYVRLGADSSNTHGAKTELNLANLNLDAIKNNFTAALAEAATWGSAPNTVYIDVTADGKTDTRRGTVYKYNVTFADNPTSAQIQVNNKNRMLITHSFKNSLFDEGATFHEMLVFAAVKYDNNWITSDNYAVYVGGVSQ